MDSNRAGNGSTDIFPENLIERVSPVMYQSFYLIPYLEKNLN